MNDGKKLKSVVGEYVKANKVLYDKLKEAVDNRRRVHQEQKELLSRQS